MIATWGGQICPPLKTRADCPRARDNLLHILIPPICVVYWNRRQTRVVEDNVTQPAYVSLREEGAGGSTELERARAIFSVQYGEDGKQEAEM